MALAMDYNDGDLVNWGNFTQLEDKTAFTAFVILRTTGSFSGNEIFAKWSDTGGYTGYCFRLLRPTSTSNLHLYIRGESYGMDFVTTGSPLQTSTVHRIAVRGWDLNTGTYGLEIWMDGSSLAGTLNDVSGATGPLNGSTSPLKAGTYTGAGNCFTADYGEFGIWDRKLTDAELVGLTQTGYRPSYYSTNLQLYVPGTSTTDIDSTVNGYTGTNTGCANATHFTMTDAPGATFTPRIIMIS